MKKLMIVAAIAMAAVSVNAAQYVWKTQSAGKVYNGNTTATYSGTAYIFADAGDTTRSKIFELLATDKASDALALALDSNSISSGAVSAKNGETDYFTYSGDINAYLVIVDSANDKFFVGIDTPAEALSVGFQTIKLTGDKTGSQNAPISKDLGLKSTAQWYTVPEPTSGLLLLLGVAGLALRRRRA